MEGSLSRKTKQGVFWTAVFNAVQYIIRIGSSIVLARILFPEDFGLMGIAMLSVQFARRLANFGFTMVLIQRKEVDRSHFDTVFYANTLFMGSLTLLLFFTAPYVAQFFENPSVEPILQVLSFDFILRGLFGVPRAILRRKMEFKRLGWANTVSSMVTLATPVILAIMGYGVWSLVWGILLGSLSNNMMMFSMARWLPGLRFRKDALKDVFGFGMWVYVNTFLNYFVKNLDYIVIGKFLPVAQLGLYERAFNLINLPRMRLQQTIYNVLFSSFSKIQDDEKRIAQALTRALRYLSIAIFPLMAWMYFSAPALIVNLYGEKWRDAVIPLQIMTISGLFSTFNMLFFPVIMAKGLVAARAIRQGIYVTVLFSSVYYAITWGIEGVAWAVAGSSLVFLFLIVQLIVSQTRMTVARIVNSQRGGFANGLITVGLLVFARNLLLPNYSEESLIVLLTYSVISGICFVICHWIFVRTNFDSTLGELIGELPAKFRKLPVLNPILKLFRKPAQQY